MKQFSEFIYQQAHKARVTVMCYLHKHGECIHNFACGCDCHKAAQV